MSGQIYISKFTTPKQKAINSAKWLFEPLSLYKNTELQFWTVCKILRRCKGLPLCKTSKILDQIQYLYWHVTVIWHTKSKEPAFLCSESFCNRQYKNPCLLSDHFTVLMMFECSIHLVNLKNTLELKSFLICQTPEQWKWMQWQNSFCGSDLELLGKIWKHHLVLFTLRPVPTVPLKPLLHHEGFIHCKSDVFTSLSLD